MKRSGLEPQASVAATLPQDVSADGHPSVVQPRTTSGAGTTVRPAAVSGSQASTEPASRSGYTAMGVRSAQSMRESHQAWADEQITTSSCAFCGWTFEGTAGEGRAAALEHRQQEHPEACIRKARRRGSMIKKRGQRTDSEEEQIKVDTAEARRVRSEREQAEMLAKIERGRERDRAALAALDGAV